MRRRRIVPYRVRLRPRAKELRLPCKFTRQKPLGVYIAGARDAARTAALQAKGLRVIRVRNDEIRESFEAVCDRILEIIES